jgi:hypothetical protein
VRASSCAVWACHHTGPGIARESAIDNVDDLYRDAQFEVNKQ